MSSSDPNNAICIRPKRLFSAFVKGTPKGQPRPRAFVRGGRAAVYDPGTAEGWKSEIAVACAGLEGARLALPLQVRLAFYMPRPKSHFRTNGLLKPTAPEFLHTGKPDVDNLAKAVLDCLTSIRAWHDDAQVCELIVRRYYESDHYEGKQFCPPGCQIQINQLSEEEIAV